ncbi:MAG: CPBP family intramembrane metalloprotease [Armatimonadetes bacterium]|nr:CPBP family intramembrane metalloprotease [Armatimonadota bacterium]
MNDMTAQDALIIGLVLLAVVVVALAVDLALLIVWLWNRDAVIEGRREPVFARRWSLLDPWVGGQVVVAALVWVLLLAMIATMGATLGQGGNPTNTQMWIVIVGLVLQNVLLVGVPYAYIRYRYDLRLEDIGFAWLPTRRQAMLGVAGGIALILVGVGTEAAVTALAEKALPGDAWRMVERLTKSFSVDEMFPDLRKSWVQFGGLFIGAAIAAPIGEEFFFRAFLHNCAKRRLGIRWGTLLSATAFAVVHGGPLLVVAIIPIGIALAWAYDRTGSLWVPIIIHAVNNGVGVLAMRFLPEGWV